MTRDLTRRALAELLGTGSLVTIVVGSGIMAERLSPGQIGLELLENSTATALGLAVLILMLAPVSGAHFNPVVTIVDHVLGRRAGTGKAARDTATYIGAQVVGGIGGAMLANAMFGLPTVRLSPHVRTGASLWLGEIVAMRASRWALITTACARRSATSSTGCRRWTRGPGTDGTRSIDQQMTAGC